MSTATATNERGALAAGKGGFEMPAGPLPGLMAGRVVQKPPLGIMESLHRSLHEARQELEGLDKIHHARMRQEAQQADETLYRLAVERFERDHKRWARNPDLFHTALGVTWMGARLLANIWRKLAEALRPEGPGLSLEIVFQTMMASGSPWKVQQTNPGGWWIMTRCLAQYEDADRLIEQWLKRSRDTDTASHLKRIAHFRQQAPGAADALSQLRKRADEMVAFWDEQAKDAEKRFYDHVRSIQENAAGTGLGDRGMMADARVFMALRKSARDHVSRLEKRIAELKKERRKDREKHDRQLERQFMRLDKTLRPMSFSHPHASSAAPEPSQAPVEAAQPPSPSPASPLKPIPHPRATKPKEPDMPTAQARQTTRPAQTTRPQRPEKEVQDLLVKHHLPASMVKRPKKLFKRD